MMLVNFLILISFAMLLQGSCRIEGKSIQESHQKVIFEENFEKATLEEILENWDDRKNTKGMALSNDVPDGSNGKQSLMMTYTPEMDEGAHLFKSFPEGHDVLYARFYVKFLTRKSIVHHLVKLGGYRPMATYPKGLAGLKPNGKDFFISGIEIPDSKKWDWGLYTYWMGMEGGPSKYWGNVFFPEKEEKVGLGKWICVEFMIKMNDPVGVQNGEEAFWINGKKVLHLGVGFPRVDKKGGYFRENSNGKPFPGFQWRSDKELKLNFFWLNYYMTKGKQGEVDQILFDEIVVSSEYIGPLQ